MTELTPTSAAAWRRAREEGYAFTLPSGKVARLRPVALDALIRSGKVPNLLIPVIARMLWETTGEGDMRTTEEREAEEKAHFIDLVSMIVPAAMLSPRVVDNPKATADEISLDDLHFGDKLAIYRLARLPAEVLDNFSTGQTGAVEPLPDGEDVHEATEQATQDS